ncbi:MAG: TIGR01620 family protein [Methylococcales bacterium]|jgi:putative membrane protein|nr:TIGR01620 family protein [Methylococcales bacterium]MBT7445866.1 TIGR01620 family protein [Methylococcales bacterium]
MSNKNWKAPVFLDLASLEEPNHDEWSQITKTHHEVIQPRKTVADFKQPVVLEASSVTVEPVAVVVAPQTEVVDEFLAADDVVVPESKPSLTPDWVWPAVGATIVVAMCLEIVFFLVGIFTEHFVLGVAYLGLFGAIFAAIAYAVRHYYDDIRRLSDISELRAKGEGLFQANDFGQSHQYMGELINLYQARPGMVHRLEKFVAKRSDSHSDRDTMLLFSENVMKPLDAKAYEITVKRSKETALMVVLSPFAFLDVILTLWRNIRLIRDIASLYGGRPGFLSSMGLIKKVLQSLAYAEVGELLADSAAETVGGSLVAALSTHIAHGVGSGVMTARVGVHAMKICRPMPFVQNDQPSIKGVRKAIITSVKGVFDKEPSKYAEPQV